VAAQLKKDLGVDTELVVGGSGEFTIWLEGEKLIEKTGWTFPDPTEVVAKVRAKMS
jgi:hypothetical protein